MAITRAKKEEIIKELHQKMERSKLAVFLNFHGIKVSDIEKLRKNLRQAGIDFKVAKKTLFKKVMDSFGFGGQKPALEGEFAAVFGYNEDGAPAKIVKQFVKQHEGLKIVGGIFRGEYVLADFINQMADLPSREIMLARLVGLLNYPMRGLVGALSGPARNLVGIIYQLSKK